MVEAVSGLVVSYDYLWAREHDRGEETGRKTRPVCVQVLISPAGQSARALLFPITSQPPGSHQATLPIPQIECRRAGQRHPAWIVVDEWNEDDITTSSSLASTKPLGRFGAAFILDIRKAAIAAIKAGQHRRIERRG
jgi:hypothetical protein